MKQRRLGADGPMVGAIGLGCMNFGGFYGPTDEQESVACLQAALDCGIDHLDVSNVYGAGYCETVLGRFIADHPGKFTIATKGGIIHGPERRFDNSEAHLRAELEGSLRRLGVDHVALYYVHRRDQSIPIEDVMGTLVKFKTEGKIGGIGLSEVAPYTLERAAAIHPVMAVQNEYSLWTRLPELGLIRTCENLGTAFVAFSPLARGMFAEVIPGEDGFAEGDFRATNPRFVEPNLSHNREMVGRFNAYARDNGYHPSALALAWVLAQSEACIPIPGTRSAEHLRQFAAGADIALSQAELDEIEDILPIGFAWGDRYTDQQSVGPERYC